MADLDLSSSETLRKLAAEYADAVKDPAKPYAGWCAQLITHLEKVASAPQDVRAS